MWSAGCKASLYIGTNCVVLARAGQARQVWSAQPWSHGLREAAAVLKAERCRRIAVWLSGGLARPFVLPVVQGLKRWRDVVQLAQATAPAATQMQDGPLNVWIGRWQADKPSLAVATEQALQQALADLRGSQGLKLSQLRPAWHWAATQETEGARLLLLHELDACTGLRFDDGVPQWVTSHVPPPSLLTLRALMARTAFTQGVDVSQTRSGRIDVLDSEERANAEQNSGFDAKSPPIQLTWLEDGHAH